MRVTVIGGSGYVGSHVVQGLLDQRERVTVLTRATEFGTSGASQVSGLDVVVGDIRDRGAVRESLSEADAVIQAAGAVRKGADAFYNVNILGTEVAATAFAESSAKRFVLVSSGGVYGRRGGFVDEETPPRPNSEYEQSKVDSEVIARRQIPPGELVIARPTNIIGGGNPTKPLLNLMRRIESGHRITMSAGAWTNYIHVNAVAETLVRAACDRQPPEALIINDPVPLPRLVGSLRAILGVPGRDRLVNPLGGAIAATLLERLANRRQSLTRAFSLVDDTRMVSRHGVWVHSESDPIRRSHRALRHLVQEYRVRGLLP